MSLRNVDRPLSCFMTCIVRPGNQTAKHNQHTTTNDTNLFQLILPILQIQMFPDGRVLTSESDNLLPVEVIEQPRIDLSWELKKKQRTFVRRGYHL